MNLQQQLVGRLAVRGQLEFRRADGSIAQVIDILDGSLPVAVTLPGAEIAVEPNPVPELRHGVDHP